MTDKKKKKIITNKQLKKSEDPVIRVDQYTFYVKSSVPDKEPYFVYREHIHNDQWLCDCADFWAHLPAEGKKIEHQCKHINMSIDYISKHG